MDRNTPLTVVSTTGNDILIANVFRAHKFDEADINGFLYGVHHNTTNINQVGLADLDDYAQEIIAINADAAKDGHEGNHLDYFDFLEFIESREQPG